MLHKPFHTAVFKYSCFILIAFAGVQNARSQDTNYARQVIGKLCADKMHGRGYYKNGAIKASAYICAEMKKIGLSAFHGSYFQNFEFPVNTFEKDPQLEINGIAMRPGIEFVVNADAPNSFIHIDKNNLGQIVFITAKKIVDSSFRANCFTAPILFHPYSNNRPRPADIPLLYIIDTLPSYMEKQYAEFLNSIRQNANTINFKKEKITWSASTERSAVVTIDILRSSTQINFVDPIKLEWSIKSAIVPTKQRNVIGYIPGSTKSDSFLIITAHYDHLGRMGKSSIFPGANDNAAGIAMLLDLAKYYKKRPPKFTMVFIAFAGEEAGLIGSGFYSKNSLHKLSNTRFLLNCDLVGTGETGMTVVNATFFKEDFAILDSINRAKAYLVQISKRGKAANSDHYFFTEMGIPSFFWYQSGPRKAYHDVLDVPQTLTLYGYNATILLAIDFLRALGN